MTDVGRMIYEEGREEGIEKGREEGLEKGMEKGKADLLIKLLIKKFKIVPDEYKKKLTTLSQDTIEVIGTEIFDMETIEDLKKYF